MVQNATSQSRVAKESSKKPKISKSRGHGWFYFVRLALLTIGLLVAAYFINDSFQYGPLEDKSYVVKNVTVDVNETPQELAKNLYDSKIIKNQGAFLTYVDIYGFSKLHSGNYSLTSSLSIPELYQKLTQDPNGINPYDIPKGVIVVKAGEDVEKIAKTVADGTNWSAEEFRKKINDQTFIKSLKKKYPELLGSLPFSADAYYQLEGYLDFGTYDFRNVTSLDTAVEQMVKNTNEELAPYYQKIKASKHSVHDVLTIASLVQKEAVEDKDKRLVAGVFLNRLVKDMPLQTDVSVKYLMHNPSAVLTNSDVLIDSPYNLYKHTGLGPGPFDTPSMESIKAVLDPAERDKGYLYFVTNLQTGEFVYSKTYQEHDDAVKGLNSVNNSVR